MVWHWASLSIVLILLCGLGGPLGALAVGLLMLQGVLVVRAGFEPLVSGWAVIAYGLLTVVQVYGDLYFVPIRARDQHYLDARRTTNAFLHARFQSLFRPLVTALVVAALPSERPTQEVAVVAFVLGTAVYWLSAWIREYVAIRRGALVLLLLETAKHMGLLLAVVLVFWLPTAALVWLVFMLGPTIVWTLRLQREPHAFEVYGGMRAPDDA